MRGFLASARRAVSVGAVLVAAAVAPSLALIGYNSYTLKNYVEADVGGEALASARLVSAELVQLLEGTRRTMIALMKNPAVPDDEEACSAYFRSVIADLSLFRGAAFIDRDGKFHCSTIPIPPTVDVHDRLYFREPLQTGQFTVGTLTTGRAGLRQEIAGQLHMSYENFRKRFARLAGMPPSQYRMRRVMERASELMHRSHITLREVADECGFCNEFHFSRRFKQIVGLSPKEYRKQLPR